MDYSLIFDIALEIGYQLGMCGAETYRIEESIIRIMRAYGADAEVFAIPNSMIATITTPDGESISRLRRIGFHGNDMNNVELYSNLSRRICSEKPQPKIAAQWLCEATAQQKTYRLPVYLLGNILAAVGFCLFFGGTVADILVSAICGFIVGAFNHLSAKLHINTFIGTLVTAFAMALTAYLFGGLGINADAAIVGAIMMLVPGLLFTNAIRDIIFGDTNSGINRLVQVILIAVAIGLGIGVARALSFAMIGAQSIIQFHNYGPFVQCLAAAVGSAGFCIVFNVHGKGTILCVLGGLLSWAVYLITAPLLPNPIIGYLFATLFAAFYSEAMARIRHFPAISYLVVAIIPLLPGSGIYFTASYLLDSNTVAAAAKCTETVNITCLMAIGILIVSTIFRSTTVWKQMKHK